MKKRDKKKQALVHKITTKRALYEKSRKLKQKIRTQPTEQTNQ